MAKAKQISKEHPLWDILDTQKERMLEQVYVRAVAGFKNEVEEMTQARPERLKEVQDRHARLEAVWGKIEPLLAQVSEPMAWTRIEVQPSQFLFNSGKRRRGPEDRWGKGFHVRLAPTGNGVKLVHASKADMPTELGMAGLVLTYEELHALHEKWMTNYVNSEFERINDLFAAITLQISLSDDASLVIAVLEQAGIKMPDLTQVGNLNVALDETLNSIAKFQAQ